MLRLTFGPADVGRVRFAVSAVAQVVRSACVGVCPRRDPFLGRWQQRVRARASSTVEPVMTVVNADEHYYPDLLTPDTFGVPANRMSLDEELDGLISASDDAVAADFGALSNQNVGARMIDRWGLAGAVGCDRRCRVRWVLGSAHRTRSCRRAAWNRHRT